MASATKEAKDDHKTKGEETKTDLILVSPSLESIASCLTTRIDNNSMYLPMKCTSKKQRNLEINEDGLLDCGATGKFIDREYAKMKKLELVKMAKPLKVYNVDGTLNKEGTIRHYVDLDIEIHGRKQKECL